MPSRILVVEDTPANIQALTGPLKDKGYQISVATNGKQGRSKSSSECDRI